VGLKERAITRSLGSVFVGHDSSHRRFMAGRAEFGLAFIGLVYELYIAIAGLAIIGWQQPIRVGEAESCDEMRDISQWRVSNSG
jgi:hypothetical protein